MSSSVIVGMKRPADKQPVEFSTELSLTCCVQVAPEGGGLGQAELAEKRGRQEGQGGQIGKTYPMVLRNRGEAVFRRNRSNGGQHRVNRKARGDARPEEH